MGLAEWEQLCEQILNYHHHPTAAKNKKQKNE